MPIRQLIPWWVLFTTIGIIIGAILFSNLSFTFEGFFKYLFENAAQIVLAATAICALIIAKKELKNNEEKILAESITFFFKETIFVEDTSCHVVFLIQNTSENHYVIEKPILSRFFKSYFLAVYQSDVMSVSIKEWSNTQKYPNHKKQALTIPPNEKNAHLVSLIFEFEEGQKTSALRKMIEDNYLLIRPTYKNSKNLTKLHFNLSLDWEDHANALRENRYYKGQVQKILAQTEI